MMEMLTTMKVVVAMVVVTVVCGVGAHHLADDTPPC